MIYYLMIRPYTFDFCISDRLDPRFIVADQDEVDSLGPARFWDWNGKQTVEANSWLGAKQKFGFELTPRQLMLLEG